MISVVRGMVQSIGICDYKNMPANPLYFTQFTVAETVVIPEQKPDTEQLLSIMVDVEVISVKAVKTPKSKSHEGQILLGSKLIIELKLKQKITYIADEPTQSVHAAHFEKIINSVFVVVPPSMCGISIENLLNKNKVMVTPYVEDIYAVQRDNRTIFKNITLFIDVVIIT